MILLNRFVVIETPLNRPPGIITEWILHVI